jgi:hypothetical protein
MICIDIFYVMYDDMYCTLLSAKLFLFSLQKKKKKKRFNLIHSLNGIKTKNRKTTSHNIRTMI